MSPILDPEPASLTGLEWPLFEIPVSRILEYLTRRTGEPVSVLTLQDELPGDPDRYPELQRAVREGLHQRLHLNLGTPGIEEPDNPIEENAIALYAAMLLGLKSLPVILSGELETAVLENLVSEGALARLRDTFPRIG